MKIFDRTSEILEKALSLRLTRHNLIAANLANMDTPGYRQLDFDFQSELRRALEVTPVKVGQVEPAPLAPEVRAAGPVDLDQETTRLAENSLQYDALTRLMGKKIELLKYSIAEGGK